MTTLQIGYTGLTVIFISGACWFYWTSCRIARLLNIAEIIQAHSEASTQKATRTALDAREMLLEAHQMAHVLSEWWSRHAEAGNDPQPVTGALRGSQEQPSTEPMPTTTPVTTDTVPESQAITASSDEWVAEQMAQIMAKLQPATVAKKPAPRKRAA